MVITSTLCTKSQLPKGLSSTLSPTLWWRSFKAPKTGVLHDLSYIHWRHKAERNRKEYATSSVCRASNSQQKEDQAPSVWPYLSPLLLAFYASQKRSSFAARSLVQSVIELYMAGQDWNDVEIELKLSGMQENMFIEQLESTQQQKRARQQMDFEKDCLLQWMMLVFLTLHELGIPQGPACSTPITETSQMAKGMKGFVQQTLNLGLDLQRLSMQQQMAVGEGGQILPSIRLMQENARLIMLSKEMLESEWFKDTFKEAIEGTKENDSGEHDVVAVGHFQRALVGDGLPETAARLLLAFMGAAHGSFFSVNAFIEEAFKCYRQGWTAQEVFNSIALEDFACGQILFPVSSGLGGGNANAEVFSQWLSTVFITLAQVGVPRPKKADGLGWAVADAKRQPDAIVANRLAHFVANALKQQEDERSLAAEQNSEATQAIKAENPVFRSELRQDSFAVMQDDSLRNNSSAIAMMSQLIEIVRITDKLATRTMKLNQGVAAT